MHKKHMLTSTSFMGKFLKSSNSSIVRDTIISSLVKKLERFKMRRKSPNSKTDLLQLNLLSFSQSPKYHFKRIK